MEPIPYDVFEAVVQVFGKAFHYRDGMASFLLSQGISRPLVDKYRNEAKFVWARRLLTELADSDEGRVQQRKVLTALCQLRNVPDPKVPDRDAALDALRELKRLAVEHDLLAKEQQHAVKEKATDAEDRQKIVQERASKLAVLRQKFSDEVLNPNRQRAGYALQDLLQELFGLFEIEFRKSFRTKDNTQEIDGHFFFQSFDYLVEAKWRKDQPTEGEIGSFKHKVEGKFHGTRGLFVSVAGFRAEVAAKFDERGSSILLMDGMDLIHVLEGRVDLRDGLRAKIEAASQKGTVLSPITG